MRGYGAIAASLTELLKRMHSSFVGGRLKRVLQNSKEAMTKVPVLALPNFSLPFELETNALGVGFGAVLMQKGKPIAYFKQVLSSKASLCSVYENELMEIVLAVKRWHHYLFGHPFVIKTDQKALKYLLDQWGFVGDQQTW